MRLCITAYTDNAHQRFNLPAIDNSDYSLILYAGRFNISRNIELKIDVIEGKWRMLPGENYTVYDADEDGTIEILPGSVINILIIEGNQISFVVEQKDDRLFAMDLYSLPESCEISIGRNQSSDIYCTDDLISRVHAKISSSTSGYVLKDYSKNGVFVDGERIIGECCLKTGECISIFGIRIVFLNNVIAINTNEIKLRINTAVLHPFKPNYTLNQQSNAVRNMNNIRYFKRSPRIIERLHTEPVEIETPPLPNQQKKQPLLLTIGPAFTMMLPMMLGSGVAIWSTQASGATASAYMYTGIITAVSSALIGGTWAIANLKATKKQLREDEKRRFNLYKDYLLKIAEQLKKQYSENTQRLKDLYPATTECIGYDDHTSKLWNRNPSHDDFLNVRIGTGNMPFQVPVVIPKERFSLVSDELADKPKQIKENFSMLKNVPIGIDLLKRRIVGVYGKGSMENSINIARTMAMQIGANNCYIDVKMVFIYNDEYEREFSFAKWMPHVWSEDHKIRYIASNKNDASDVFYALTGVLRERAEQDGSSLNTGVPKPYYVVFICDMELLDGEPAAKFLLSPDEKIGLSTIVLAEAYEQLPNTCTDIIQNDSDFRGLFDVHMADEQKTAVRFDRVTADDAEHFARKLAGIKVNELESGGGIVPSLSFFELHKVTSLNQLHVLERWHKNRTYENLKALVGQKAGGADVYLDVHEKYHGPHGLVAGTTGSGKSETLQTYILSLAVNFSPLDVGFFIIDYKGGGMANLFSDLPHMVGRISNLSGNQVIRAMVSIKSEIKRRQQIFSEYEVNHLDMYTRLIKNNEATIPIPHLLIIIDEFAELKREEPDFMRELISVAQVGRSLGIHLILATQKPAGTVDDNIWSNSKFRLCLRVQDRQDSIDMLKRADAAYITQAGRCYFQVGNDEVFELFQSGWSGATYDEESANVKTEVVTMLSVTGRPALVGNRSKFKRKEVKRNSWLSALMCSIHNVLEQCNTTLDECLSDQSKLAMVVKLVFEALATRGIDYPYSQFNARRIEDLIRLISENENMDASQIYKEAIRKGVKLPEEKERTQLSAVVEYLGQCARESGMVANLSLWMPVLPDRIYLPTIEKFERNRFIKGSWPQPPKEWEVKAVIGMCDDPVNQAQTPVTINFAQDGNTAICGMVVSGKSTFLQTMLYALVNKYSPDSLNFYILDYSSRMLACFAGLHHCGGVVFEDQADKTSKLFTMMIKELDRRKKLFNGGNYEQYMRANGLSEPTLLIIIDGFANFREKTNDKYDEMLLSLLRDGFNYGIIVVVSAGGFSSIEIPNRINELIKTVFCLQMSEKMKYVDALRTRIDLLPEKDIKGRGLAIIQGQVLEYQTALALEAEDDYRRSELMSKEFENMNESWNGKRAHKIPEIPDQPIWDQFAELEEFKEAVQSDRLLPIGYNAVDASVYSIDISKIFTYLIAGKRRTGKSNTIRCLMKAAALRNSDITVIDTDASELQLCAVETGATHISDDNELVTFFRELFDEMLRRNTLKKDLRKQGASDEEMFKNICKFQAKYIFVDDFASFVKKIYMDIERFEPVRGFIENFFEKGSMHNIFVIAGMPLEEYGNVVGRSIFDCAAQSRSGMLLGGNVMDQRLFDMSALPYNEQSKALKNGIALLAPSYDDPSPIRIVIPAAKR